MKTSQDIETDLGRRMNRFEREYMGQSAAHVQTHLIGNLLVVRLREVLTASEQRMVRTLPVETGRTLLKQIRTQLMEAARPIMEAMILEVTGVKLVSLHHDISTVSGEKVVLFTLASNPLGAAKARK